MSETVKAGVKTSEFWVTIIAYVVVTAVTILNGFFELGLSAVDIAGTVLPVVFYVLGRAGVKMFSKDTAKQVAEKISAIDPPKPVPQAVPKPAGE